MKELLQKKTLFSLIYLLSALIVETVFFLEVRLGVVPTYYGVELLLALGLTLFIFCLPSFTAQATVALILLFLQVGISCINEALLRMSGMVFSLTMLNLAKEVGGVFTSDFVNWGMLYGLVLGWVGLAFLYHALLKNVPAYKTVKKQQWILCIIFFLLAQNSLGITTFGTDLFLRATLSETNEDHTLWSTQYNAKKTYKKFGFFGFYYQNVGKFLDKLVSSGSTDTELKEDVSALDYYFAAGDMSKNDYDSAYTGLLRGKNVVLVVIESGEWYAINGEYTPTLYAMASQGLAMTNYYARDKTNHSEALSLLGSYPTTRSIAPSIGDSEGLLSHEFSFSLPTVLGEAGYTTHYAHANDGSFYSRRDSFSSLYGFDECYFLEDMPLLDGASGKDSFYDFDRDSEILKNYADELCGVAEGDSTFFAMLMSLVSHGSYEDLVRLGDYAELEEADRLVFQEKCTVKGLEGYYDLIKGYPKTFVENTPVIDEESETIALLGEKESRDLYLRYKRYQAGIMDLDAGINSLVKKLEREGTLQDTAFVFYADHSAYYNNLNYLLKGVPFDGGFDDTIYNIPFFIWSGASMDLSVSPFAIEGYEPIDYTARNSRSALKQGQNDKFCNTFDILPTLLQLEGFSYNKNLYHGESVFSQNSSLFVSRESGSLWDGVYYDGINFFVKDGEGEYLSYDYEDYLLGEEYLEEIEAFVPKANGYYEKQSYLESMYDCDYFAQRDFFKGHRLSAETFITYLEKI